MDGQPDRGTEPGGNVGRDAIDLAAHIALAGLDASRWLRTQDPVEALVTAEVARRVLELHEDLREDQAVRIANAVGKMLDG